MINIDEDIKEIPKNKPDETVAVEVMAHIVIKDVTSGKEIINQRG